jgi:osmotically-inducible protein OsmY
MKITKLFALLLPVALIAGCAGTDTKSGTQTTTAQRSTGEVIDDAAVTAKVKSALLADPEVNAFKINVDTSQGKVVLKGEIKTLALRKKAESIAKQVNGVRSVDNQLVITG